MNYLGAGRRREMQYCMEWESLHKPALGLPERPGKALSVGQMFGGNVTQ